MFVRKPPQFKITLSGNMIRLAGWAAAFLLITVQVSPAVADCPAVTPPAPLSSGTIPASVRDAATGQPVVGAIVEWSFGLHDTIGSTDIKGGFTFQLPVADPKNGEQVKLVITHNSYAQKTASVTVCAGTNPPLSVELAPIDGFGAVVGQVTDSITGLGIPNAAIAIMIGKFPAAGLTTTTGSDGRFAIGNVGYSSGLILQVTTEEPPCVSPARRPLDVHQPVVTENFVLPVQMAGQLRCASPVARQEPRPSTPIRPADGPRDSGIQWQLTTADAILTDGANNVWHSGHINDILKIGPQAVLVASESAGVWSVTGSGNNTAALPLSTTWDSIIMTSLAAGPDGTDHVYAGTSTATSSGGGLTGPPGVLWETDTSATAPLLNWVRHQTQCGNINHILVINELRRIVLACDNGIWWSPIPVAPAARGTYNWLQAQPGPGVQATSVQRNFSRLAKGPGWGADKPGTLVASVWGGTAPNDLIFWGSWTNSGLSMNIANVPQGAGKLFLGVGRTTVASCPADQHTMYAIGDYNSPQDLAAVWRSADGGQNWTMVNLPPNGSPPNATGHQGDYNQALAVSPLDCNTVVIAWSYSSFVSFDSGQSYPMALNGATSGGALHDDYHAVLFDPYDARTVWIGSDGGIASASGIGMGTKPTFASYYNQHLTDLQFYHTAPSRVSGLLSGPAGQRRRAICWIERLAGRAGIDRRWRLQRVHWRRSRSPDERPAHME
jgi:hypothetical protein